MARRRNRTRKTRGRFRGLYRVVAVLVIAGAIFAACVVFFRIEDIRVEGEGRYTAQEIVLSSGLEPGDYLAFLDKTRITRKIRAELPYIERVSIRRILPDGVVIAVEESAVAAAVRTQDQWWLVNAAGKLLESVPAGQASAYPSVVGVELLSPTPGMPAMVTQEEENRWNCVLELLAALEERGERSKLNSLDCSSAGSFTARYDGRYTLLLPTTIEYAYVTRDRFRYFLALLQDALPQMAEGGQDLVDFTLWESTGRIYARHAPKEPEDA